MLSNPLPKLDGVDLPRRITLRVPSHADPILRNVAAFVRKNVALFAVPDALKAWLQKCITVIPEPPRAVGDILKQGAQLQVPQIVVAELESRHLEQPFAAWKHLSAHFGMWLVYPHSSNHIECLHNATMQRLQDLPCQCPSLFSLCPTLKNATSHVILRSPGQWQALFGPVTGRRLGGNPRNRVLPSPEVIVDSLSTLSERLISSVIPVFSVTDSRFQKMPIMPPERVGVAVCDLFCNIWSDVTKSCDATPWLDADVAADAPRHLRGFGLQGGGWDKALSRPAGLCSKLSESHLTDAIIFGNRFSVWGWSASPDVARAIVPQEILAHARNSGVLADAILYINRVYNPGLGPSSGYITRNWKSSVLCNPNLVRVPGHNTRFLSPGYGDTGTQTQESGLCIHGELAIVSDSCPLACPLLSPA